MRGYAYDNTLYGFFGFGEGYNALTGYSSGMGDTGQNCHAGKTCKTAPCVDLDKSISGSGETHKVNLNYKFDSDALIYFTYSTGYRPGGNNRNGNFGPYQADYLTNYEVGWKTSWFEHRLIFNGAVYLRGLGASSSSPSRPQQPDDRRRMRPAPASSASRPAPTSIPTSTSPSRPEPTTTTRRLTKNFCVDPVTGLVIPTCATRTPPRCMGRSCHSRRRSKPMSPLVTSGTSATGRPTSRARAPSNRATR